LARAALLLLLVAVLVTTSWLRLEDASVPLGDLAPVAALALVAPLVAWFTRSRLAVGAALLGSTIFAASSAFGIPLSEAQPRDPQHDFFGPVLDGIRQGFLDFYDARLPFNRLDFQLMHAVVLLAIFGFIALAGVFLARSQPVAAALVLVSAVGWPATLNEGGSPLRLGAMALLGVLAILFLLRAGNRPARGLTQGVAIGAVLIAVAVLASSSQAVAKGAFLSWQNWDPYDRPEEPVSVSYVWGANYLGIDFPEKKTTVLRIKAEGAKRSLYWRATTLDDYTGSAWAEGLELGDAAEREQVDAIGRNPLLPKAAADEDNWIRQDVTVEALRDTHLIGSAQPVRWRTGSDAPVRDANGDVVVLPRSLQRDQRYTVWSYVPRPKASELITLRGNYPQALDRYLEVGYQPLPDYASPGRSAQMAVFFERFSGELGISATRPVYDLARQVTERAESPYAAAVALEGWFREEGGFVYDERPGLPPPGVPALVWFVTQGKTGYCQHYAGSMALMLRLLGIPARVAAGFTSGNYDTKQKEWVVTDHNAHTWVEVWFPRFGWLAFDPTPDRGRLAASYSPYSSLFNAGDPATASSLGNQTGSGTAARIAAQEAGRPGQEGAEGFGNPGSGPGAVAAVRDKGPSLVLLALLVLGGGYAAVVVLKAIRRTLSFAARDPRELAAACRRDVVGFLADQGHDLPESLTLPELGATLDRYYAVNADHFVRHLAVARFGRPDEAREALRRARRELRDLRRALRRSLSIPSRVRGAASLRSLAL
jgi:protein-glutamine gamma-glutamyltransferase